MADWLSNAIFYEVYPQSFQDTNADGIGDFKGIIKRLDYIKELGCNAIWMNPCYDSPFMDAGYDVTDYYKVAPRYGTNEDLKELFDEIHKREMHILLDLVPGHTSYQHKWFKESMKAEKNEYTNRYIWTNSIDEFPECLHSIRGFSDRFGTCAVNFYSLQPALNYGYVNANKDYQLSPEHEDCMKTRQEFIDIMKFWLSMGCDGFRVDMAGSLIKKDDEHSTENIKLWNYFMDAIKTEYPDAAMVSEWGEPKKSIAGGFDMDFLLHFGPAGYTSLFRSETPYFSKEGKGDIRVFVEQYKDFYQASKGKGYICIPSGNHDMQRLSKGRDMDELKICFAFLLSMPGVPFIYYGDEIGMKYLDNITSKEGGYYRTGARTPMQWNSSVNAGFSTGTPDSMYIMLDPDKERPTVEKQEKDEWSLLNEVRRLNNLRMKHKALQSDGEIEFVYSEKNTYPFAYIRRNENEKILVVINPSGKDESCTLNIKEANVLYYVQKAAELNQGKLSVPACSATFFQL